MGNLRYGCALVGVAALSAATTVAAVSITKPKHAVPTAAKTKAHPVPAPARAAKTQLATLHVRVTLPPKVTLRPKPAVVKKHAAVKKVAAKHVAPAKHPARHKKATHALRGAKPIGASPSLYERTTSIPILHAQGCLAGKRETSGLVVLDFGKLAYRPRRGGYGTVTFADRFASNRAITWALKAYARGYSECLPHGSTSKIILARGTSNYGDGVPSSYTAGRLWGGATVALGNYLKKHNFDHVTAAAADDVEPAWDPGFLRTYHFFSGYRSTDHGYLLYNYGSLDGGVGGIWKLHQAYYVAGGMKEARAVPEIYNREMAHQWAELARLSVARYGKPIKLAGLMTQHWTSCSGCGYTAPKARHVLRSELAKATPSVTVRTLSAVTNIGSPPAVDISAN